MKDVKLSELNQAIEEIVQDMIRAKNRGDKFESEICYWQLQGIMYALDLLGLYEPRRYRKIDKECEKYLDWLLGRNGNELFT